MDLRARDCRAASLLGAVELLDGVPELGLADLPETLGELAGGPRGYVGLGRARVVDDLPLRKVAGGQQRPGLTHRGGQREVARRHHPDRALPGRGVDLGEVVRRQARGADDDAHSCIDRCHDIRLDRCRRRVVDEDVDAVERLGHAAEHPDAERVAAERLAEVAPGGRAAHG
jgi:hypothetical protein